MQHGRLHGYLSPRQGPCKEHGTRKRLRSMATRKRPGTRKGCHYSTTERLRRCVYSSDRACPCHAYDTTLGWPLPVSGRSLPVSGRPLPVSRRSPIYRGTMACPIGVPFSTAVILSAAKDLRSAPPEIQSSRSEPALRAAKG